MITLVREITNRSYPQQVLELPRWVPPVDGSHYWHIPRSAGQAPDGALQIRFWCGVSRHAMPPEMLTDRTPTENICGTCVGRADGYQGIEGKRYKPRSPFDAPKWCPAVYGHPNDDRECTFCGGRRRWSGGYRGPGESVHRSGPGLIEFVPCPEHGWRDAGLRDGRFACRSFRCDYVFTRKG